VPLYPRRLDSIAKTRLEPRRMGALANRMPCDESAAWCPVARHTRTGVGGLSTEVAALVLGFHSLARLVRNLGPKEVMA